MAAPTYYDITYFSHSEPVIDAPWLNMVNQVVNGLASTADSALGSALVGYKQGSTGSVGRTLLGKLQDVVSVLDFIPVAEHPAILSYTSTTDVSTYFNLALAAAETVYVPAGGYLTRRPINMTGRRVFSTYWGRRLIGEGPANTYINAYTGNYPCIDCTGMSLGEVSGINFRSDNPSYASGLVAGDCASIGLLQGRGLVNTSCNQLILKNLRFNLTSDMTRNDGTGTVGICNRSAEHVIRDACEIYANLPLVDHSILQFTISPSSDLPTYGIEYEAPYVGLISNTVHENRNLMLISWDSFRAWWAHQAGQVEFHNLYTSTRTLAGGVPAYGETFYITGSSANVKVHCYQEASGLFGATYRQDHRYITFGAGPYFNMDFVVGRGAVDQGFPIPGAPVASVLIPDACSVANSRLSLNYLPGIYDSSSDNNGFAVTPVTISGTPHSVKNVDFTLDNSTHNPNIFADIGPYCKNVTSRNYLTGRSQRCDSDNTFTPVVTGTSTAGTGTYTTQAAKFEREGGWCRFTLTLAWSAHTGTGNLTITGLPLTSDLDLDQAVTVFSSGLTVGTDYQIFGRIANNTATIELYRTLVATGVTDAVPIDAVVAELTITGCYKIGDLF